MDSVPEIFQSDNPGCYLLGLGKGVEFGGY